MTWTSPPRLAEVDAGIADAARAAGRDPGAITRIVVTKFHPASLVDELYELGVRDVGENRQQELSEKVGAGRRPRRTALALHRAGADQQGAGDPGGGIRRALGRPRKIADALDAAAADDAPILDVLLQVNLTDDPKPRRSRARPSSSVSPSTSSGCRTLRLRGVMAVAPLDEEPGRGVRAARATTRDRVRAVVPDATWISAGMTADFAEAIAAGATHLRIGSAITGPRPPRG